MPLGSAFDREKPEGERALTGHLRARRQLDGTPLGARREHGFGDEHAGDAVHGRREGRREPPSRGDERSELVSGPGAARGQAESLDIAARLRTGRHSSGVARSAVDTKLVALDRDARAIRHDLETIHPRCARRAREKLRARTTLELEHGANLRFDAGRHLAPRVRDGPNPDGHAEQPRKQIELVEGLIEEHAAAVLGAPGRSQVVRVAAKAVRDRPDHAAHAPERAVPQTRAQREVAAIGPEREHGRKRKRRRPFVRGEQRVAPGDARREGLFEQEVRPAAESRERRGDMIERRRRDHPGVGHAGVGELRHAGERLGVFKAPPGGGVRVGDGHELGARHLTRRESARVRLAPLPDADHGDPERALGGRSVIEGHRPGMVDASRMSAQSAAEGRLYFAEGAPDAVLDGRRTDELLERLVAQLGPLGRVLLIPPDFTRRHSGVGPLTTRLFHRLGGRGHVEVLPALGTHAAMTEGELETLYPGIPKEAFHVHDWRHGVTSLGEVPASVVHEASDGRLSYPIRCEVARLVAGEHWDRIISLGQLVPHEVAGIAGQSKNVFVGTGGKDVIDRTHYLGAVCGMEAAMGRARTPVRKVLSYMRSELASALPITYVLTVRGRDAAGALVTRGLFAGDDDACFFAGESLVRACNVELLDEAPDKIVVYLDPSEFKSTWLGNKAIYRTRLAVADAGELLVLAPGVHRFGEDAGIDRLVRRHGYRGTERTLAAVDADPELAQSLSAAAHLIHGSSEGRFRIRYAAGGIDAATLRAVGYEAAELAPSLARYDPARLTDGMNELSDGERIYFVRNPALGLWSLRDKLAVDT